MENILSLYWSAGKPVYFAIYHKFWGFLLFYFYHPVMSHCKKNPKHCLFEALWGKSQWPMGICTHEFACHSSWFCWLPTWGILPNMIYFLKQLLTEIQSPTWLWICQWYQLQTGSHFQFVVPLWALNEPRSSWTAWCSLVDKFKCDGRPAFKLYCSTEG